MELKELTKRAWEIKNKYSEFNKKRGEKEWGYVEHAQGLVSDVGNLMKLMMAKNGFRSVDDLDKKIAHELADCLWSLAVIAEELGVDLDKAFDNLAVELKERFKI